MQGNGFFKSIKYCSSLIIIFIFCCRLQIIRGRTLFNLNVQDEQFAFFVTYSKMFSLEMPALRDILQGSVGFFNNFNLCHIRSIDWNEIMSGPTEKYHYNYIYNFTLPERECPKCHESCEKGCWGEGPSNCQKFSKIDPKSVENLR